VKPTPTPSDLDADLGLAVRRQIKALDRARLNTTDAHEIAPDELPRVLHHHAVLARTTGTQHEYQRQGSQNQRCKGKRAGPARPWVYASHSLLCSSVSTRPGPMDAASAHRMCSSPDLPRSNTSLKGAGRRWLRSGAVATGPAIEATGIVKRYGETVALAGVDLDVPRGAVLSLLGPNGAGKTTAVRILTTLTAPTEGSARVAGFDVVEQPQEVRRRIGLAAQDATVDGLLTGRENLTMIGELHHLGRKPAQRRADELLERFALVESSKRLAREYSGGMRRRLDLAATLVAEPEILFLDEPTTGLDPRARLDLWEVLEGLVEGGVTVLLTTQYLEEAERLADDIAVVDHGRVIARGDARSLKREVGGDQLHVVAARVDDLDRIAELMAGCARSEASVDRPARTVTAPTEGGPGAIATLASELASAGIAVEDLGLRQPTLDDVFLTLTGTPANDGDVEEAA
jgi:ABC-2 type transport system ATP-binding protein